LYGKLFSGRAVILLDRREGVMARGDSPSHVTTIDDEVVDDVYLHFLLIFTQKHSRGIYSNPHIYTRALLALIVYLPSLRPSTASLTSLPPPHHHHTFSPSTTLH
jgi:hypothetical protein